MRSALLLLTLLMGVLLGLAVNQHRAPASALAREAQLLGPNSPLGSMVLPPLPAGVRVDDRGVVQGIDAQVAPGTKALEWEVLRTYEYSQAVGFAGMPPGIQAYDGQRVTMVGFLQPLYEFTDIRQFALVGSHWSCCFGMPPGLNGVVNVTLAAGQKSLPNTMEPLRVVGTFHPREVKEEGWLISIFSLDDCAVEVIR